MRELDWPPMRRLVYVGNVVLTPVVGYLFAKGYIGELELTLWGAEVTAVMALAGYNTNTADDY